MNVETDTEKGKQTAERNKKSRRSTKTAIYENTDEPKNKSSTERIEEKT